MSLFCPGKMVPIVLISQCLLRRSTATGKRALYRQVPSSDDGLMKAGLLGKCRSCLSKSIAVTVTE